MNKISFEGGLNIIKNAAPSRSKKNENANPFAGNPFAGNPFGLSFNGRIIKSDIFEKTADTGIKNSIKKRGSMAVSAVVTSLTNIKKAATDKINPVIKPVVEPVVGFVNRVREHANEIVERVERINLTQFRIPDFVKPQQNKNISKGAQRLLDSKQTPKQLGERLEAIIANAA